MKLYSSTLVVADDSILEEEKGATDFQQSCRVGLTPE